MLFFLILPISAWPPHPPVSYTHLIPLFLAFFTYNTAADIISAQCNNQVRNMLQQTKDITDSRLKELKSIPLTLDKNEYIMKFHQEWIQTNSTGNIFTAYKASHSIPKYDIINSSVENIRLFFGKPACCFIIGVDNAVRYTQDLSNLYWDDTATVSDTHLDVYKRERRSLPIPVISSPRSCSLG